jgi:uncharacterized small protein (DUF1192 family)
MFVEDEKPKKAQAYAIGQDISTFSIQDIDVTIQLLQEEIKRLLDLRGTKLTTKSAADALFKF